MALPAKIAERMSFLAPKSSERTINNQKFTFHAVRLPMVRELLKLMKPMASAIGMLLSDARSAKAVKSKQTTLRDRKNEAEQVTNDVVQDALPLELVKFHAEQHKEAIDALGTLLIGEEGRNFFARFVVDSLRYDLDADQTNEFWNRLDLDIAIQFIAGAVEANAKVIRPFLGTVGLNLRAEALEALRDKLPEGSPVLQLLKKQTDPTLPTTSPTSTDPSSSSSQSSTDPSPSLN